jgi:hypothetical protein
MKFVYQFGEIYPALKTVMLAKTFNGEVDEPVASTSSAF